MFNENKLIDRINLEQGLIEGASTSVRCLADLRGYFIDQRSFAGAVQDNPVVYTLSSVEYAQGEGQLHCGLGKLMPGKIGPEYFFTRGHLHTWRQAAELYFGLAGDGHLLLEHENGRCDFLPLAPGLIVYVPGFTAHRTVNTGPAPLVYLGVYPAQAGHDYAAVELSNFRHVVVEIDGKPQAVERQEFLQRFARASS